jgi:hypothetical protein
MGAAPPLPACSAALLTGPSPGPSGYVSAGRLAFSPPVAGVLERAALLSCPDGQVVTSVTPSGEDAGGELVELELACSPLNCPAPPPAWTDGGPPDEHSSPPPPPPAAVPAPTPKHSPPPRQAGSLHVTRREVVSCAAQRGGSRRALRDGSGLPGRLDAARTSGGGGGARWSEDGPLEGRRAGTAAGEALRVARGLVETQGEGSPGPSAQALGNATEGFASLRAWPGVAAGGVQCLEGLALGLQGGEGAGLSWVLVEGSGPSAGAAACASELACGEGLAVAALDVRRALVGGVWRIREVGLLCTGCRL